MGGFFILTPVQAEEISNFSVLAEVQSDSSVLITENIHYDFGEDLRHGIFRDIPVRYTNARGRNFSVNLKIDSVTNAAGQPYFYETSRQGRFLRVRIGDPETLVRGEHTYVVSYKAQTAVNFFDERDEFYWNVTGNDWSLPINKASIVVHLPTEVKAAADLSLKCFTGPLGSDKQACRGGLSSSGKVVFETTGQLAPKEGLTVALGFPKGIAQEPSWWERNWRAFLGTFYYLALIAGIIIAVRYFYKRKKL
jgi:hypothetical protein